MSKSPSLECSNSSQLPSRSIVDQFHSMMMVLPQTKWPTNFLREEFQTWTRCLTSTPSAAERWLYSSALNSSGTARLIRIYLESSWTQPRLTQKWTGLVAIWKISIQSSKMLRRSFWLFSNWYSKETRYRVHICFTTSLPKFIRSHQRVCQWATLTSTFQG